MANPWFRMYHEFSTDPKVQMLSEADQRRFVMLLCMRCCNGDETLHDEAVAFQLRISNEEWTTTKTILVAKQLIDNDNKPIAWNKRQYESDSSTARVAKHRDKKKLLGNVTGTPPEAETDSETDTEEKKGKRKKKARIVFVKPTLAELELEFFNRVPDHIVQARKFLNHHESKGWKIGNASMVSWPHAVNTWVENCGKFSPPQSPTKIIANASDRTWAGE
jgi:hypothetical protein